jgi:hypothetical protein
MSAGKRIERFSERLRIISHLAAEQNPLLDRQGDLARNRSVAAAAPSRRQVFFRFSTRQSMLLVITLSICFAVNRHNHLDDFLFLLSFVVNPYSVTLMSVILLAWVIGKSARPGRDRLPSGRPIPDGRVPGDSSGSREDVLSERLRSLSRLVSEQRHPRGAPAERNSAIPNKPPGQSPAA